MSSPTDNNEQQPAEPTAAAATADVGRRTEHDVALILFLLGDPGQTGVMPETTFRHLYRLIQPSCTSTELSVITSMCKGIRHEGGDDDEANEAADDNNQQPLDRDGVSFQAFYTLLQSGVLGVNAPECLVRVQRGLDAFFTHQSSTSTTTKVFSLLDINEDVFSVYVHLLNSPSDGTTTTTTTQPSSGINNGDTESEDVVLRRLELRKRDYITRYVDEKELFHQLYNMVDLDGNGVISETEFIAMLKLVKPDLTHSEGHALFTAEEDNTTKEEEKKTDETASNPSATARQKEISFERFFSLVKTGKVFGKSLPELVIIVRDWFSDHAGVPPPLVDVTMTINVYESEISKAEKYVQQLSKLHKHKQTGVRKERLRARLREFYQKYNPEKLQSEDGGAAAIETIVNMQMSEDDLFEMLYQRYNVNEAHQEEEQEQEQQEQEQGTGEVVEEPVSKAVDETETESPEARALRALQRHLIQKQGKEMRNYIAQQKLYFNKQREEFVSQTLLKLDPSNSKVREHCTSLEHESTRASLADYEARIEHRERWVRLYRRQKAENDAARASARPWLRHLQQLYRQKRRVADALVQTNMNTTTAMSYHGELKGLVAQLRAALLSPQLQGLGHTLVDESHRQAREAGRQTLADERSALWTLRKDCAALARDSIALFCDNVNEKHDEVSCQVLVDDLVAAKKNVKEHITSTINLYGRQLQDSSAALQSRLDVAADAHERQLKEMCDDVARSRALHGELKKQISLGERDTELDVQRIQNKLRATAQVEEGRVHALTQQMRLDEESFIGRQQQRGAVGRPSTTTSHPHMAGKEGEEALVATVEVFASVSNPMTCEIRTGHRSSSNNKAANSFLGCGESMVVEKGHHYVNSKTVPLYPNGPRVRVSMWLDE